MSDWNGDIGSFDIHGDQAVISGKYGGGVFCTLSDETVCLCHYSTLHSDLDFHVGDTVILAIKQFDYERSLIYGRILSKW